MRVLKISLKWLAALLVMGYIAIATYLYFNQENLLFYPQKLTKDFKFTYDASFEEMFFKVEEGVHLNGLLFKADSTKGLVFYLHGNAGSLATWGRVAKPFNANGYDCFILDYRGYGKSDGAISSEKQWHSDIQKVYNELLNQYKEENVIILGYSVGSGPSAYLASQNSPQLLILKAPYNNIAYMLKLHYPWLPAFALRYQLTTDEFLQHVKTDVIIFHGEEDKLIPLDCSIKLKEGFKLNDRLIILKGQGHHNLSDNDTYVESIGKLLK